MAYIDCNETTLQADVIVLGAGPGGCTAAILLAQAGLKVLLCEKVVFPAFASANRYYPMATGYSGD